MNRKANTNIIDALKSTIKYENMLTNVDNRIKKKPYSSTNKLLSVICFNLL